MRGLLQKFFSKEVEMITFLISMIAIFISLVMIFIGIIELFNAGYDWWE